MKKPKLSLGPDGIKGLLIRHVEKIAFGLAILLVVLFVASGFKLQSELEDKTPPELETLATSAAKHIESPTADELRKERIPRDGKGGQYESRLVDLGNTSPGTYETPIPWDAPLGETGVKRQDPEVFPPIQIETNGLTGPICVRGSEEESLLAELDNAPRDKKRRSRGRRSRGRRGGDYESGSAAYEAMEGGVAPWARDMAWNRARNMKEKGDRTVHGEAATADANKTQNPHGNTIRRRWTAIGRQERPALVALMAEAAKAITTCRAVVWKARTRAAPE